MRSSTLGGFSRKNLRNSHMEVILFPHRTGRKKKKKEKKKKAYKEAKSYVLTSLFYFRN